MPEIVLYQDTCLGGETFTASGPVPKLGAFNDRASSIVVKSGKWILYKDVDFKGESWIVDASGGPYGKGVYIDWKQWQGCNDCISSLQPV